MKRLMSNDDDDETVDRLSELPDSLIFEILSFLETRDVVRTISLVSKGWKDLWTTIPYLCFNDSEDDFNPVRTQNLINGVLQLWKGTKISRFLISLPEKLDDIDASFSKDMARWVAFAVEKKVENLQVHLPYDSRVEPPECLYSCSSITWLGLIGYNFPTERGIELHYWVRLKRLVMYCQGMNEGLLHQLVSSAPQLQVLSVWLDKCLDDISIRSSCLKWLKLHIVFPSTYTTLTICAPNLKELTVERFARVVLDAPALTQFSLLFHDNIGDHVQVDEEALKKKLQLFLSIQHVKELELQLCDYKWLVGDMKGKCLFSNVKILTLSGGCDIQPSDIGCLADLFPNVEKVLIFLDASFKIKSRVTLFRRHDFGEKPCEEANFLEQLRRVEVIWGSNETDEIYNFIMLLLNDAIMVQEIVIKKVEDYNDHESEEKSLALKTQKMQSLQGSFPTVNMIFL